MAKYPKGLQANQADRLAETIIDWVTEELAPDDLWGDDYLIDWAAGNFSPEDLFTKAELEQWAFDNGFRRFE